MLIICFSKLLIELVRNNGLHSGQERVCMVPMCVDSPRVINVTQGVPCITVSGTPLSVGGRVGKSQTAALMARAINGQANKHDPHH